jgi:hypothetical protein
MPTDCELDKWIPGECNVTCGGGTLVNTRPVVTPASGAEDDSKVMPGVQCTATAEEEDCAENECPVDCVVSAWSDFSECSAECGGGQRSKSRTIVEEAMHGGNSFFLSNGNDNWK